ncbi:MAG: O-antigen ligase family protein [Dehalococcoidia bacterium]
MAGYLAYLFIHRRLPGPTRLDWPIAALIVVYAIAIATSIYPRVSLEASLAVGMALVTFYVFHDLDLMRQPVLMRGLAAVGVLAAVYALIDVAGNYVDWLELVREVDGGVSASAILPPAVPRVTGVGDNVNVLAMALNLTLPFTLALALRPLSRFERPAGAAGALLILAALFFTLSRGAWLGTFAALGAFFLLYVLRDFDASRLSSIQARIPPRLAIGVGLGALLIVVVGAVGLASWDSRPEFLFRPSLGPRADAAEVGIEIVRDRPFFGSGPYTYSLLYSIYSGKYPVENIHPHNGYVNVLVDIGFAGGLVLLVAGLMLAKHLYVSFRDADARQRILVAACVASLVSLAVHSLADSPNAWTTALMPLAAVLALSLRLQPRPDPAVVENAGLAPRLMVLALPLLMIGLWVHFDGPHRTFNSALGDLRDGEFGDAYNASRDAAGSDPSLAAYNLKAGVDSAILYLVVGEKGRASPQLLEKAAASFEKAIEDEPRGAISYANLALVRLLQNNRDAAVNAARRALGRTNSDGAVAMAAGTVLEWAGYRDEAAYAYGLAVSRDPGLVQSPFWTAANGRFPLRQVAIESSGLTPCDVGRIDALFAGYGDDLDAIERGCREIVDRSPGNARARADLAVVLLALGRDAEARQEAQAAVNQVPDNPFIRTSLGIALAGSGDLDRVRHELAIASHLGDPDATLLLTYTYEPPSLDTPVISRIKALAKPGSLPDPVLDRLRVALPASSPMVFDNGIQYYPLGALYYRVRFLRESPTSILVPGEWLGFGSPRSSLIAEALKKH